MLLQILLSLLLQRGEAETKRLNDSAGARMENQQFLGPGAVLLSLALSSHPFRHGHPSAHLPGAGGGVPKGRWMRSPLLLSHWGDMQRFPAVTCGCFQRRGHIGPQQPPSSQPLNFSCSPLAPAFPRTAPCTALCFPRKETKEAFGAGLGNATAIAAISSSSLGQGSGPDLSCLLRRQTKEWDNYWESEGDNCWKILLLGGGLKGLFVMHLP